MNFIVSTDKYYSDEISKELVEYLYKDKTNIKKMTLFTTNIQFIWI